MLIQISSALFSSQSFPLCFRFVSRGCGRSAPYRLRAEKKCVLQNMFCYSSLHCTSPSRPLSRCGEAREGGGGNCTVELTSTARGAASIVSVLPDSQSAEFSRSNFIEFPCNIYLHTEIRSRNKQESSNAFILEKRSAVLYVDAF